MLLKVLVRLWQIKSSELIHEGYIYILTGRLQTDPLERRFSQYSHMLGVDFWLVLMKYFVLSLF